MLAGVRLAFLAGLLLGAFPAPRPLLLLRPASACSGKIDLAFCLDGSGSMSGAGWTSVQAWTQDFIRTFSNDGANMGAGNDESGLKVAIFQFASYVTSFTKTANGGGDSFLADYQLALSAAGTPRKSGGTETDDCIRDAHAALLDVNEGARDGASKLLVILTDGAPNSESSAISAARAARGDNIRIIGVGVDTGGCYTGCKPYPYGGGDWSNTKLVTPPHDDHYIKLGTYGDLTTKLVTVTSMACPVDCSGTWGEWTTCSKTTGRRQRAYVVINPAQDSGQACPPDEDEACEVPCESSWGAWGDCNEVTGKQKRAAVVDVQPLNGGAACPADEIRDCDVPCEFTWEPWSACVASEGYQERVAKVTVPALNGGTACPPKEGRACAVDCVFAWNPWGVCDKATGTQTRDVSVSVTPKTSHDGMSGAPCPPTETQDCAVPCEFTWYVQAPFVVVGFLCWCSFSCFCVGVVCVCAAFWIYCIIYDNCTNKCFKLLTTLISNLRHLSLSPSPYFSPRKQRSILISQPRALVAGALGARATSQRAPGSAMPR